MIEFEKAKIIESKATGKKGVTVHRIHVVAQVNEAAAKALGDDVRNTLYNSKGVIRPSFGKMDLTHVFADANFHLAVTGIRGAEIQLEGVTAHRFRVAMRGGGEKKPKTLLCGFEVEYINKPTGSSSLQLWEFLNKYIGGVGAIRLKYPEQQPMFTEKKEPEIVPGVHKYAVGKFTAELHVTEVKEGWASTRKAAAGNKKLPQKPPVTSPSESEALALAAYDVRTFADKAASASRGAAKKEAQALAEWAVGFAGGRVEGESKPTTVAITKHTN